MKRVFSYLILIFIIIPVFVFALLNAKPVMFYTVMGEYELPLALLLVISFLLGVIVTAMVCWIRKYTKKTACSKH